MGFKFFKSMFGVEIEISDSPQWEQVTPLPQVRRTSRIGMDKNFRVGRVKHVSYDRTKMLIDVIEMCFKDDQTWEECRYNMWVNFDREWQAIVSKDLKGQYVVFGFFIQSFRQKDLSDVYENVFTCRFINLIPTDGEAKSLAIDLAESRLFVNHPYLKLSNVNFKL